MKNSTASIIVTTKNEGKNLARCLDSIKSQTYKKLEIIVVDNYSTDQTFAIARRYTKEVHKKGPERSAQRNYGARRAHGAYVFFLDADMILTKTVVAESVDACEKQHLFGVVVPEKSFGEGFWARCKAVERLCYERVDWIESARFFRRDIVIKEGGYDERLTGPEDFELPQRIKSIYGSQGIGRISSYILHNEGSLSLANLLKKKYYYGQQMRVYSKLKSSSKYFKKQSNIALRYLLFLKRLDICFRDPVHYFGMLVMKLLEMTAAGLGAV